MTGSHIECMDAAIDVGDRQLWEMLQVFLEPCQFGKSVVCVIRYKYKVFCFRIEILYHFNIFFNVIFVCATISYVVFLHAFH